ncbi:hypothetical protein ACEPAH_2819 [Sanghuangporus vaninii]
MAIKWSKDLLLQNIYINSTSFTSDARQNTDGVDSYSSDIVFRNWTVDNGDDCISNEANSSVRIFSGTTGECGTSTFQISDVTWDNISGTLETDTLASLQCSGAAYCPEIRMLDFDDVETGREVKCSNVLNPVGPECTSEV